MKKIVMTGGGTGGHLAIVKSLKETLKGRADLIYIGSTSGQDRKWFEEDTDFGSKFFLESRGVVDRGFVGKIGSLSKMSGAFLQSLKILKSEKVDLVFSVGGYSSAPASMASIVLGIPLVIHEQNASVGTLNRILRPFSRAFISSYDPESPISEYPTADIFFEKARVREKIETVIFLGGSQGAVAINDIARSLTPELKKRGISIIHQAGEKNLESMKKFYEEEGVDAELFGFSDRLPEYMSRADFAIARAGASTLWELASNALPTLFIPYPYAAGDHQYHNALYLSSRNMGWVMRENELDMEKIVGLLDSDPSPVSSRLIESVRSDGSEKCADLLLELASS